MPNIMRNWHNDLVWTLTLLLLMAQGGLCEDASSVLPNWLVGTIAVCVFLVLAFVFMLVNNYICVNFLLESDDEDFDEEQGYENHVMEIDDDMPKEKVVGTPKATKVIQDEYSEVIEPEKTHQYEDLIPSGSPEPRSKEEVLTTSL